MYMLSGLNKTRNNILSNLSRSKTSHEERIPDVDFAVDIDDNMQHVDNELAPFYSSCTYMIDNILDIRSTSIKKGNHKVLVYSICTFAVKPFLLFRLKKWKDTCVLSEVEVTKDGVIPYIADSTYQGLIDGTNILVYQVEYNNTDVIKVTSDSDTLFVTVDDIINQKRTFSWEIDNNITDLFLRHEELIYLQDQSGELVETPMSAYRGDYYNMIGVLAGLGVPRSGPYSSLGPYFYFADYSRSLRFAVVTLNGKPQYVGDEKITIDDTPVFIKGGMVKYILFLGNTKVLLNLPSDPDDDSLETLKMIESRPFIKNTIKLRDSAGKWTKEYDSVIQPLITIYDTEQNRPRVLDPQIIVKNFRQQMPLQYVYLDTNEITLDHSTGFYNIAEAKIE